MNILASKLRYFLLFSLYWSGLAYSNEDDDVNSLFNTQWTHMQEKYKDVIDSCDKLDPEFKKQFLHPWWTKTTEEVQQFLLDEPCRDFLSFKSIAHNMIVKGIDLSQKYNLCFLRHLARLEIRDLLSNYQDSDFFLLPRECKDYDCSSNALRYLYYSAKSLEKFSNLDAVNTIVEFGSGYGGLTHVLEQLRPQATFFLIDLPEFLAIQYLALSSISEKPVYLHTEIPTHFEDHAIHLIPVFLINDLTIKTDLFISTYALSESPEFVQNIVVAKGFFNASSCYITGQLNGWSGNNFPNHSTIIYALRKQYPHVELNPFYLYLEDLESYEAVTQATLQHK